MEDVDFSIGSPNIQFINSISEGAFMKTIEEIKANPKLEIQTLAVRSQCQCWSIWRREDVKV